MGGNIYQITIKQKNFLKIIKTQLANDLKTLDEVDFINAL